MNPIGENEAKQQKELTMKHEHDTPRDHTARLVVEAISKLYAARENMTVTGYTMQPPAAQSAHKDSARESIIPSLNPSA